MVDNLNNTNQKSNNIDTVNNSEENPPETSDEEAAKTPIDFTIQLTDINGEKVAFPLSRFSALQRTLDVTLFKMGGLLNEKESEIVFQTFYFPLAPLKELNNNFKPFQISEINFIFDKSPHGVVIIDKIGFTDSFKPTATE